MSSEKAEKAEILERKLLQVTRPFYFKGVTYPINGFITEDLFNEALRIGVITENNCRKEKLDLLFS